VQTETTGLATPADFTISISRRRVTMVEEVKIPEAPAEDKSPEQTAEEKHQAEVKLFTEHPEYYIKLDSLVAATRIGEDGKIEVFTNEYAKRNQLVYSLGELEIAITRAVGVKDLKAARESRIVKPKPGGIMNFIRGGRR